MQNLVKASTSLNSAHQEQLIATSFGANGQLQMDHQGRSNLLSTEILTTRKNILKTPAVNSLLGLKNVNLYDWKVLLGGGGGVV